MNIQDFISVMIVGTFLSGLVQYIKVVSGASNLKAKFLTVALALVVAGVYVGLKATPYFETAVLVLTTASTVYALLKPSKK